MISSFLCDYLKKYAGPGCANLRIAIEKNVDLYQLWVENAHAEGVRGPSEVRTWTHLFPHAQDMITPQNVKRWLRDQGLENIALTVECTEGGDKWLEWQVERFRSGLWGS